MQLETCLQPSARIGLAQLHLQRTVRALSHLCAQQQRISAHLRIPRWNYQWLYVELQPEPNYPEPIDANSAVDPAALYTFNTQIGD